MKLLGNDEGVSEVFGYVVILGIVMTGFALILLLVLPSIQSTKDNGQLKELEQGFTVVDSRLSKARFSTSIFQEAPFKLNNGVVTIDDDYANSHIIVDKYKEDPPDSDIYIFDSNLYDGKLGTIKVTTDNGEVAYQDGGVWLEYPNGDTVMLSPPDFDYNGVTLTLPIMQITRDQSNNVPGAVVASGQDSTMLIDSKPAGDIKLKYPDPAQVDLVNPLEKGRLIRVTITSDYYKGWYSYFKELGLTPKPDNIDDAKVTRTIWVDLESGHGRQIAPIDNDFDTKYLDRDDPTHKPIYIFQFIICTNGYIGNGLGNAYSAQYHTDKQQYPWLEISVGKTTAGSNKEYAQVLFTYHYGSANSEKEEFRGWMPFQRKSDSEFIVDIMDEDTTPDGVGPDGYPLGVMYYDAPDPSISWGDYYDEPDGSQEVTTPDTKSAYDVTQHYMWIMAIQYPDGPIYEHKTQYLVPPSQFNLQFKSGEQIKYLYITEAELDTGISSRSS